MYNRDTENCFYAAHVRYTIKKKVIVLPLERIMFRSSEVSFCMALENGVKVLGEKSFFFFGELVI